jgi:hypothetical protein
MKKLLNIFFYFLLTPLVFGQNPEPKKVTSLFFPEDETLENVTPALQKKKGFTDYEEMMTFLNSQKESFSDLVSIDFIGKSQKGYDIPIVYINNKKYTNEKVKVWYQGGLHGNEMGSTETMLYLIYKLLNDKSFAYLLEKIEIAIVPMANIDGYLKEDRYASNGLDLNRDQTKLMAPESVILKNAFSNYKAEVALDFHEYNAYRRDFAKMGSFGVSSIYDVMFLYSSNLNVAPNIRVVTDSLFVGNVRKVMDKHQLRHADYMSTDTYFGEIHFNRGSSSARSSASSYALANSISALIEVRGVHLGRTSFKRRIKTAFLTGLSFLETTFNNFDLVKKTLKEAQSIDQKLSVISKKNMYKDTIEVIDMNDYSILNLPITVRDAKGAKTTLEREKPEAYILTKEMDFLIEKIKTLGLQVETLTENTNFSVETYQVIEYNRDETTYEKMNLQEVKTKIISKEILFPAGSFRIHTNQKNARLLYEVLEPEMPSSFVSFGVLETGLHKEIPIYRLSQIK